MVVHLFGAHTGAVPDHESVGLVAPQMRLLEPWRVNVLAHENVATLSTALPLLNCTDPSWGAVGTLVVHWFRVHTTDADGQLCEDDGAWHCTSEPLLVYPLLHENCAVLRWRFSFVKVTVPWAGAAGGDVHTVAVHVGVLAGAGHGWLDEGALQVTVAVPLNENPSLQEKVAVEPSALPLENWTTPLVGCCGADVQPVLIHEGAVCMVGQSTAAPAVASHVIDVSPASTKPVVQEKEATLPWLFESLNATLPFAGAVGVLVVHWLTVHCGACVNVGQEPVGLSAVQIASASPERV